MSDSLKRKSEIASAANHYEIANPTQLSTPTRHFKIPSSKLKPSIFGKDKKHNGNIETNSFDITKTSATADVGRMKDNNQSFDYSILRYQNPVPYRCVQTPPVQRHAPPLNVVSSRSSPTSQSGESRHQPFTQVESHLSNDLGHTQNPHKSPNKSPHRSQREGSLPLCHSSECSTTNQQARSGSAMGRSMGQNGSSNTCQFDDKNKNRVLLRPFSSTRAPHLACIRAHPHNESAEETLLRLEESQPINNGRQMAPHLTSSDGNAQKSYKQSAIDSRIKVSDKSPDASSGYYSHSNEPSFSTTHGGSPQQIDSDKGQNNFSLYGRHNDSCSTDQCAETTTAVDFLRKKDEELLKMRGKMEKNESAIIAVFSEKISKLEKRIDKENREKQKLEDNYKTVYNRLEHAEQSVKRLTGELSNSSEECQQLKDQLSKYQAECCRLDTRCINLERALKETGDELEYLTADLSMKQSKSINHKSTQICGELIRSCQLIGQPFLPGESLDSLKSMLICQARDFEQERSNWLNEKRKVIEYQKKLQITHEQLQRKIEQLEKRVVLLTDELKHKNQLLRDYTRSQHNGNSRSGAVLEKSQDTHL